MKYKDRILRGAMVPAAALAMAAAAGSGQAFESSDLAGKWRAETIDDWAVPAKFGVTITFETKGKFHLRTGCNSISGAYQIDDGKLVFGKYAITAMACDEERTVVQGRVAKTLHGEPWQLIDGKLVVVDTSAKTTTSFKFIGANH